MSSVLVITPYYAPDIGPSAPIFTMLCEELARNGHAVTCVTTIPHYDISSRAPKTRRFGLEKEIRNGITLFRIRMPISRGGSVVKRLTHQLYFNLAALIAGFRLARPDVCVLDGPSLWSGLSYLYWTRFRRVPYLYNQHDIFPDVAWRLGWLKRGMIFRAWDWVEKLIYRNARQVLVLAESARKTLVEKGVPRDQISIFPVPVNFEEVEPSADPVDFKEFWGLQGRAVVFYGGNLGQSQRIMELAEAAKLLQSVAELHFVIVGEGDKKAELAEFIRNHGLKNVSMYPFQERARLFDMYRSFDCGVVPLSEEISAEVIPSKAIYMMAAGMPIVAWGNAESELSTLMAASGGGLVVSGGPQELAEALLRVASDRARLTSLSVASARYAREHFDTRAIGRSISALCQQA